MIIEQNSDTTSVINDEITVSTIRDFLRARKPSKLRPLDLLLVIHLMTRKAEDHNITDSLQTLASRFNCSTRSVARAQQRLADSKVDYLSRTFRKGGTSLVTLNYQNIPAEAAMRLTISDAAKQLAFEYERGLRKRGRKRFNKNFLSKQQISAQRILNKCGGDLALASRMVSHALDHASHEKKSRKSLYELLGRWKHIQKTYEESYQGHKKARSESSPQLEPATQAIVLSSVQSSNAEPEPLFLSADGYLDSNGLEAPISKLHERMKWLGMGHGAEGFFDELTNLIISWNEAQGYISGKTIRDRRAA